MLYTERAFIQIAGFTFGKTQSYFDFVGGAVCYGCGYGGHLSQFGAGGTLVFAYSATLGNGFTATIALEDGTQRRTASGMPATTRPTRSSIGAMPGPGSVPDAGNVGGHDDRRLRPRTRIPDIVGSLRVDQAWGSAQISAAAAPDPRRLVRQQLDRRRRERHAVRRLRRTRSASRSMRA